MAQHAGCQRPLTHPRLARPACNIRCRCAGSAACGGVRRVVSMPHRAPMGSAMGRVSGMLLLTSTLKGVASLLLVLPNHGFRQWSGVKCQ
jgi:hypothetical protein